MAAEHQVFARTALSMEQVVADVAAAVEAEMVRGDTDRWHGWVGKGTATAVSVEEPPHGLEPDEELPLDRYPIMIEFEDYDLGRQEQTARTVFRRLTATGRYSLLLVGNLQTLLDRSDLPG